jgi:TonB family protein
VRLPLFFRFVALFPALLLGQQNPLVKAVAPDYGSDAKLPSLTLPLVVEFTIASNGKPFSIASLDGGLLHSEVMALSQYEFVKSKNPTKIQLTIPLQRTVANYTVPGYAYSPPMAQAREAADKLDDAGIAKMEKDLSGIDEPWKRTILLTYAASHADSPASQEMRTRHLEWLIRNASDMNVVTSSAALIPKDADPSGYAAIRQLWLDLLKQDPTNRDLMEGATNFLKLSDPADVRAILGPYSNRMLRAAEWLGGMYGLTAIGARAVDLSSGTVSSADPTLPADAFGAGARAFLMQETQLPVLLSAFATMNEAALSLNALSRLPQGYEMFCQQLLARIQALNPNFQGTCQDRAPGLLWVPQEVMKGSITRQDSPVYPQAAKNAKIEGRVRLEVAINKSGKTTDVKFVSGPLDLYAESRRVVSLWEYRPYTINGAAVEVKALLDVNYRLQPGIPSFNR